MRIAATPCHVVPPSQHVPSSWTRRIDVARQLVVVAEADEHLVKDDVVQDRDAGFAREPVAHANGERATTADQIRHALLCRASAARRRRRSRARVATTRARTAAGRARQPRRPSGTPRTGHRAAMRIGVADDDDARCRTARSATCAGRWPTSRPCPCPATSGCSRGTVRAHSPNAPSTCSQPPCAWTMSAIASMSSNEPVFTLPAWAATISGASVIPAGEHVSQELVAHPALLVGRDALQRRRAEAQHLQRDRRRDVRLATNDDAHPRRALQTLLLDVPAPLQTRPTGAPRPTPRSWPSGSRS